MMHDEMGKRTVVGRQTALRVDPEWLALADALAPHAGTLLGLAASRSDVLRMALTRGLGELETQSRRRFWRAAADYPPRDRFAGFDDEAAAQVSLRVSEEVIAQAEALIGYVSAESRFAATRSDVLRSALDTGLRALARDARPTR